MTMDLWMLVASAALQWALIMTAATPRLAFNGLLWDFSNRIEPGKELPAWANRMQRARDNLQENLVLMAILVLVVYVTDAGNATSAMGAQVFFGARVLHAVAFIAGIPYARTVIWAVSIAGMAMIGSALI